MSLAAGPRKATNYRGRRALAWVTAIAALTATGCAPASAESPAPDPMREVSSTELALIARAEGIFVEGCMEKHGFKYWPPPPVTPDERHDFPYVLDDVGWAHRHGYGSDLVARRERLTKSDPNINYLNSLTPQRRAAASVAFGGNGSSSVDVKIPGGATIGQSATGCLAESQRTLYGEFPVWVRALAITGNLSQLYRPAVEHDPAFTAAVTSWAACMGDAGLQYASPRQIQAALPNLTQGMAAGRTQVIERRLAVAEATCAHKSGLAATAKRLDQRHGASVRMQYGKEIRAKRRLQLAAARRAQQIARPHS